MDIYIVRPGDSLYTVARRFCVDGAELALINQLGDPDRLAVGQALIVPGKAAAPAQSRELCAYAYTGGSTETLRRALPCLTALFPFCFRFSPEGSLLPPEGELFAAEAAENGVISFLTLADLDGDGSFSPRLAHSIFTDEEAQKRLSDELLAVLEAKKLQGVQLFFQNLYPFDREAFSAFTEALSRQLHRAGYLLLSALPPEENGAPDAYDYALHGRCADRVVLTTYDWGHLYGPPRPVSPADKIRSALCRAVKDVPPEKLLMGFSNYAYSWALPWRAGDRAVYMSNAAAQNLAVAANAQIKFDPTARCPYFNYTDTVGQRRQVWFDDARSIRARLELMEEFSLAGIACWTLTPLWRPIFELFSAGYETAKYM